METTTTVVEGASEEARPPRQVLVDRIQQDLVGPGAIEEVLRERPSERYLTGILFPRDLEVGAEEDDESGDDTDDNDFGGQDRGVSLASTLRPSSAGISFGLRASAGSPSVRISVHCGTYLLSEEPEVSHGRATRSAGAGAGTTAGGDPASETGGVEFDPDKGEISGGGSGRKRRQKKWSRVDHSVDLPEHQLSAGDCEIPLDKHGITGLKVYLRAQPLKSSWAVTAALVNDWKAGQDRDETEERTFFQTRIEVRSGEDTDLRRRPSRTAVRDEDDRISELIYRDAADYAVGHTCSAGWLKVGHTVEAVHSEWLPRAIVPSVSPEGDEAFAILSNDPHLRPLSAQWLAEASPDDLARGLRMLPGSYRSWLDERESELAGLTAPMAMQARENIERCRAAAARMEKAIDFLESYANARTAFQLANLAMDTQRRWARGKDEELKWRPFQLGFMLLTLRSVADRTDPDRKIMDLLWFPTGGGKTEAYLGLTAFTLFHRRLVDGPVEGAGVAVLMRYTLRVLTVQQFQRAAALVLACEFLRRTHAKGKSLGDVPFSLGLWVGGAATPNRIQDAKKNSGEDGQDYRQVRDCPCCGKRLSWKPKPHDIEVRCVNGDCELSSSGDLLPIYTVDELVYRHRPSLVIGTVDKFAQVTRNIETGMLFSTDGAHLPPDLIIQDELHLISGPLGTLTALYEVVVDELCRNGDTRVKVVGSTATIRRAKQHIDALFDRDAFQFPPPAVDAANSCFSVEDRESPGRLYVGLSTVGRSPKFTLQAGCASLLQGAADSGLSDPGRDPYWTLVAYFNSLRELGGALVLMHDDVTYSVDAYARRRGEEPRAVGIVEELTSRKSQSEIPDILKELGIRCGDEGCYDALLASNMISVGMDIPRLGLMVMNGQPKGIAEYIQATSRVGRGEVSGLILSIFNNGRARDRSHFETFPSWHQTLYRDVEATSVTPFAARARDRGLHGVLVALVRHRVPGMATAPTLGAEQRKKCEVIVEAIVERVRSVDKAEADAVRAKLESLLDGWSKRDGLQKYWDDFGKSKTLLMSAEQHAAKAEQHGERDESWPTPNSMREVEPSTAFIMKKALSDLGGNTDGKEQ